MITVATALGQTAQLHLHFTKSNGAGLQEQTALLHSLQLQSRLQLGPEQMRWVALAADELQLLLQLRQGKMCCGYNYN